MGTQVNEKTGVTRFPVSPFPRLLPIPPQTPRQQCPQLRRIVAPGLFGKKRRAIQTKRRANVDDAARRRGGLRPSSAFQPRQCQQRRSGTNEMAAGEWARRCVAHASTLTRRTMFYIKSSYASTANDGELRINQMPFHHVTFLIPTQFPEYFSQLPTQLLIQHFLGLGRDHLVLAAVGEISERMAALRLELGARA